MSGGEAKVSDGAEEGCVRGGGFGSDRWWSRVACADEGDGSIGFLDEHGNVVVCSCV